MSNDEPIFTRDSPGMRSTMAVRLKQLAVPLVVAVVLVSLPGGKGGIGERAVCGALIFLVACAPVFIVAATLRIRAGVAWAYPGSNAVAVRDTSMQSRVVALVFTPDDFKVLSLTGPTRLAVVKWSDVTSVTVGRLQRGRGQSRPTLQIEIRDAAPIVTTPLVGPWWSLLFPTTRGTTRVAQDVESIRMAAVQRTAGDTRA